MTSDTMGRTPGMIYTPSLVACLVVVPFAPGGATFLRSLKELNWATYVVGLSIVGVELAILLAYRAGWRISLASVVANVATALLLVIIGVLRPVHRPQQLGAGLPVLKLGARRIHAARHYRGAETREQRPHPMVDRERVGGAMSRNDRHPNLA